MIAQGFFQGRLAQAIQYPWRSGHCVYKPETANGCHHNCKTIRYRGAAYGWL